MFEGLEWKNAFKRAAVIFAIWLFSIYALSIAFPGTFNLGFDSGAGITTFAINAVFFFLFFVVFTFGELFILPTGLGLFARLAPPHLGATTVAAWFLVIFSGSLSAGLVGRLWSSMEPAAFFLLLAGIAATSAVLLGAMSGRGDRLQRSVTPEQQSD